MEHNNSTVSKDLNGNLPDAPARKCYMDGLDGITKARYVDKLKVIGNCDPYELEKSSWSGDMSIWPEVTYPDIVNYLVYTQSAYTLAELKAFKSLQSYNYFISGFVQFIGHQILNGMSVFLGKVKHSQRMTDPSLKPWLIVENDGSVSCGHCTCMAGIGEVCSHVGALLFAIEAAVKIRNSKTVTEEKAYWMLPNAVDKVQYKKICDIDFTSAKAKKKKLDQAIENSSFVTNNPKQRKQSVVQVPTATELTNFFTNLSRTGSKPVLLSLVPTFATTYRPKVLDKKYPVVMTELYSEDYGSLLKPELETKCDEIFNIIKVTKEEAINCEVLTRDQSKSKAWFRFRSGRITASRAKRVCRSTSYLKPDNPSKSLIKDICYPVTRTFTTAATQWGCEHEKNAKIHYIKTMSKDHMNFQWHDCGLIINPEYPYMGASPDGKATCDCCGEVVVEIKCPFCQRNDDITSSVDCLKTGVDGKLQLDYNHAYFYQVQCQLLLAEIHHCDFVVWTSKDFFIQRIEVDNLFCQTIVSKSNEFFKKFILPELVGKFYSRPLQNVTSTVNNINSASNVDSNKYEEIICICRAKYNQDTDDVIGCDNESCPYVWLHFKCAGIKQIPKGQWFCKACK